MDANRIPGTDHFYEDCWCDPRIEVVPSSEEK